MAEARWGGWVYIGGRRREALALLGGEHLVSWKANFSFSFAELALFQPNAGYL
jgi:hypothetical protein